jgi:N-acetylmuramoyl-L-alanine amidase
MEEKRLSIFAADASFSIAIHDRGGDQYTSLNDLLERMGSFSSSADAHGVKLRFNSLEADFQDQESTASVSGTPIELNGHALLEGDRVLIPVNSLSKVLPALLGSGADYHAASRRLFLADAGTRFALELQKSATTQLVLSFGGEVNPEISTEPGKLRLLFKRDPIAMSSQNWEFNDDVITSASFTDSSEPELTVRGSQPMLATFENNGKTIVIAPATDSEPASAPSASAVRAQPVAPPARAASGATTIAVPSGSSNSAPQPREYLIAIDAGHGGAEAGAVLTNKLQEKEITLAIARRLRKQLEEQGVATLMLRDSDTTLSLEQRALLVNSSRVAAYVAIHAGGLSNGVRVYTSMLPPSPPALFVPWEIAQSGFVGSSRMIASNVVEELHKNAMRVPAAQFSAPLRPLNNIAAAAVAIEVGPVRDDLETLSNSNYQDAIAQSLASALVTVRKKIEAQK